MSDLTSVVSAHGVAYIISLHGGGMDCGQLCHVLIESILLQPDDLLFLLH